MVGVTEELDSGALSSDGLSSVFETARDDAALEAMIERLLPHERARFQEQQELQDDQADRANGRISRGGHAQGRNALEAQRKTAERQTDLTLAQLLLDATYHALHETAMDTLHDAEREIDQAILNLINARDELLEQIATVEATALRTAEGRIVFTDGDQYRYADGGVVAPEDAATVVPKASVEYISYDEYRAMHERVDDYDARIDELAEIRDTRLLQIRDELTDDGASHTSASAAAERVKDLTGELEAIRDQAQQTMTTAPRIDETSIASAKPDTTAVPSF